MIGKGKIGHAHRRKNQKSKIACQSTNYVRYIGVLAMPAYLKLSKIISCSPKNVLYCGLERWYRGNEHILLSQRTYVQF